MLEQFRRYRKTRNAELRDELIHTNLPLVYSIARRYQHAPEPLEDLVQEGAIGLLKAIDGFDPDRGMCFSTYAFHLINRHITHYLRDYGYLIRQPARKQELNHRVARTADQLAQRLDRTPRPEEIARELDLPEEVIERTLQTRKLNDTVSLHTPLQSNDDHADQLIDRTVPASRECRQSLSIEDRIVLEEAIARLKARGTARTAPVFLLLPDAGGNRRPRAHHPPTRRLTCLRCALGKVKADLEVA